MHLYDIIFECGNTTQEYGESVGEVTAFCKLCWPNRVVSAVEQIGK